MIFAIDFDGTSVEHEYPKVGPDVPGAVDTQKWLVSLGHNIILWTMRSDKYLQDAVDWYKERGIPLYGVNANPDQSNWTNSPKCYAQLYIDDASLGCPLVYPENGRPYVDWVAVKELIIAEFKGRQQKQLDKETAARFQVFKDLGAEAKRLPPSSRKAFIESIAGADRISPEERKKVVEAVRQRMGIRSDTLEPQADDYFEKTPPEDFYSAATFSYRDRRHLNKKPEGE